MESAEKKIVKTSKYYGQNKIVLILFIAVLAIASAILYIFFENNRVCEYFANLCLSLCAGCVTGLLIWIFEIERKKSLRAKIEIAKKIQEEYDNYQKIRFHDIDFNKIKLKDIVENPTSLKIALYNQQDPLNFLSGVAIGLGGDIFCNEIASEFVKKSRKKIQKIEEELEQLVILLAKTAGIIEDVELGKKELIKEDLDSIQKNDKIISTKFKKCYKKIGSIFKKAYSKLNITEEDIDD